MSRYVVLGAGAVGGVVGARLHRAEHDVTLIARGEHLARIRSDGLVLDTFDERYVVDVPAAGSAAEVEWAPDAVVLLAVKAQHTESALDDLVTHAPADTTIVCVQNGVANEPAALRRFARVYGITVMLPSQRLEPGVVVQECHPVPGILDVGRYPSGVDETAEAIAADLHSAGFESVPRPDIMAWKYRKLLTNAAGDVRVLFAGAEADDLREQVRSEGEAVLAAAGITAVTAAADRERRGDTLQQRPDVDGPNSLGQSLQRGTSGLEVDYRAGELVLLGRTHGVPTPANERVQRAAHQRLSSGFERR